MLVVRISINFSWTSHHFDAKFVCVAVSDHTYRQKNISGSNEPGLNQKSVDHCLPLLPHSNFCSSSTARYGTLPYSQF
jgi:hypothetical protein